MKIPLIKSRSPDTHKGTCGRVLIVGGSRGMTGAPVLAGTAASRSGAGTVTIAVPDRCVETVASFEASYMTVGLPDDNSGRFSADAVSVLNDCSAKATAVGLGPGLSKSEAVNRNVLSAYTSFQGAMVVDADALNALASIPDGFCNAGGPRIITPHLGEFRRMIGAEVTMEEARDRAAEIARKFELVIVLKGPSTLVTDGREVHENETGNPGMATGGSGDVLTGVITALAAQGYSALEAAILGTHAHGLAGDIARDSFGELSMLAENIRDCLPDAFVRISSGQGPA